MRDEYSHHLWPWAAQLAAPASVYRGCQCGAQYLEVPVSGRKVERRFQVESGRVGCCARGQQQLNSTRGPSDRTNERGIKGQAQRMEVRFLLGLAMRGRCGLRRA